MIVTSFVHTSNNSVLTGKYQFDLDFDCMAVVKEHHQIGSVSFVHLIVSTEAVTFD